MCRGFAALRDAITTKDQIRSALSDRIPTVSQKTYIRTVAGAASSLKGGVLWNKDKLKASKGCCQSR